LEELQLALTTARVDQRNFGLWISSWQVGQTLNALVTNQLPNGGLVLNVDGRQITASADIAVQQGTNLLLEVKELRPVPTLRILTPVPNAPAAASGGTLQLLLAGPSGVASAPPAAVAAALQSARATLALPAPVGEAVDQLLRLVPRGEHLGDPLALARALQSSGLFHESSLAAAPESEGAAPGQDFKAALFRVLARADAALAQAEALRMNAADAEALLEMKRELEAGLARVSLNQLASLPVEGQTTRNWQFEIPVALAGQVHDLRVELEREGGHAGTADEAESECWRVKLQLAPPALGPVELRLELQEARLVLSVAAEHAESRAMLDGALPALQRALASQGLELAATAATTLSVPSPQGAAPPAAGNSLDLRA
jgi:hypothetical protein